MGKKLWGPAGSLLLILPLSWGCPSGLLDLTEVRDAGERSDAGTCSPLEVRRYGECVPIPASCTDGQPCQNDGCCVEGECLPHGVGPCGLYDDTCRTAGTPNAFVPRLSCEWSAPGANWPGVFQAPLVADFDLDGDPTTLRPSVVVLTQGELHVLDGSTCAPQASEVGLHGGSEIALGDVTGDGRTDIALYDREGLVDRWTLRVLEVRGTTLQERWRVERDENVDRVGPDSSLSLHDLDDDGSPELLLSGYVFSSTGTLRIRPTEPLAFAGAVFGDLDADGAVEAATLDHIYEADLQASQWKREPGWSRPVARGSGPYVGYMMALADFGDFGEGRTVPEVVVAAKNELAVVTLTGRVVFGPFTLPTPPSRLPLTGLPAVADFDGDGRPEVGLSGWDGFRVFDMDCDTASLPSGCGARGVRFHSSSLGFDGASSVVFDFEGDGAAEAVVPDACFVRVLSGRDGRVLASLPKNGRLAFQESYPVVADVDGDFNAELIVPSAQSFSTSCSGLLDPDFLGTSCGASNPCEFPYRCVAGTCRVEGDAFAGIRIFEDASDAWVRSRPIWNQRDYHVTHVGDDGAIPRTSAWAPNWSVPGLNNFRQNTQGSGGERTAPDLTIQPRNGWSCDGSPNQTFVVRVCNRGTEPVASGVSVSFYNGPQSICPASQTQGSLVPGACEEVICQWSAAPSNPVDIEVIADDPTAGFGTTYRECREDNNRAIFSQSSCSLI